MKGKVIAINTIVDVETKYETIQAVVEFDYLPDLTLGEVDVYAKKKTEDT